MNIEIRFVPILTWTTSPTRNRRRSPFKSGLTRTNNDLKRELAHLQAKNVVVQGFFAAGQIRRDGLPLSTARPTGPGMIVSFDSKHGPLSYPCDTFGDWEANLRAITLGMEALRAVDRYGVTKRGEQYKGWAALPPAAGEGFVSPHEAAQFVATHGGDYGVLAVLREPATLRLAFRSAASRLHPDVDGDPAQMARLNAARDMIEKQQNTA